VTGAVGQTTVIRSKRHFNGWLCR